MIIAAIVVLSGVVLVILFNVISSAPSVATALGQLRAIINYFTPYLVTGMKLINELTFPNVIHALLTVIIALESFVLVYKFVMWLVKKIPMFGVSD